MPIFFSKPGSYPVDSRGIAYTLGFFSSKRLGTGQFYLITFKDKAAHDKYQDADKHKQFIEENKDNWKKVRVFDSLVG